MIPSTIFAGATAAVAAAVHATLAPRAEPTVTRDPSSRAGAALPPPPRPARSTRTPRGGPCTAPRPSPWRRLPQRLVRDRPEDSPRPAVAQRHHHLRPAATRRHIRPRVRDHLDGHHTETHGHGRHGSRPVHMSNRLKQPLGNSTIVNDLLLNPSTASHPYHNPP
ncbi:hypothetical protein VTO42DRAFT_2480 [Malbranchea cinnamomea]